MAQENAGSSNLESVNAIYAQRVGNLNEADEKDREDIEALDEGFDHSESTPHEEQRFVANPDELRKEADSEEKFLPTEDVAKNVEPTDVEESAAKADKPAAKKAAAKK